MTQFMACAFGEYAEPDVTVGTRLDSPVICSQGT